ncbi:unnamed protein product [Ranitomeya imitator]|uniref:Thioredoxin domain-containing protein n=1 Tax=Ranitomeya imitator TaxID=111125 RepID=A0ABN9L437_9NEOB|nr:unnamed protein product [Ranitomeya imitator]
MWLNKEVRQAINSKKKAFALLKQDGTIEALKNYREKNTLSKKLIKAAKKETEKHIAKESKTNPKLFFNYINSKRIKTENVGPLKNSEERMVVDDEEKANILNTFFSTVFTGENEMLGEIPRNNENPILRVTNLTQEEVRNRLNKIKIDKSPGPDGIHPRVLRELSNIVFPSILLALKISPLIEKISDHKDFKKLLRTRNNVLVLYSKSAQAAERPLKLLDSESRKLCKKMKVDPSAKTDGVELLHYKDGTFHTAYNRPATYKSMVAFLKDPEGAPLWEENPDAKDIVHIDSEKDFRKLLKKEDRPLLVMFYAPWCGVCKRLMPAYQQAASDLKGSYVLAGMNVFPPEFERLKEEFSVKGYPTVLYFEKGKYKFNFEKYGATAKDIADWLKNPEAPAPEQPEVPWSEQDSAVHHLTDADFDQFVQDHPSVLVMFYAPK